MSIGYASLTVHVRKGQFRTCQLSTCTPERLQEVIAHNVKVLESVIDYNIENDIKLYRISSDLIPFGSSSVNTLDWETMFHDDFQRIDKKIQKGNVRISMHPGQYTVLNSPNPKIVEKSIEDLRYHVRLLRALGGNQTNKLILHVGGVYGDRETAIQRFINTYHTLPEAIKTHLVIENDERSYPIDDCIRIHEATGVPVVFDNLHHYLLHHEQKTDAYWIRRTQSTWKSEDGPQKVHYSQQDPAKQAGAHSQTIDVDVFSKYYLSLEIIPDIMLEVKDKNLSAIKCINCFERFPHIKYLEKEWTLYKYQILAHSQRHYQQIRTLLKDKKNYPVFEFYRLIDEALMNPIPHMSEVNTLDHIWGYFKNQA
ncbi:MAG: UV DNA damage repair endonuclease UvsE, partial [Bacilli bacterium]|nr:UV DNA damage repair endonuclease UvsE [Bacilli bacterium]